ncbi:hypothetical protein NDU88_005007 [Pleurodeles waltl]|uniref:Uncharacterized protein n=1 Tax=Pleurodeles waltl TaxID=8319 RepID=A0AAV7UJP9_PLEWA|nr:hypothetical protein NDU88_005007 [Pleurodeles waltl]
MQGAGPQEPERRREKEKGQLEGNALEEIGGADNVDERNEEGRNNEEDEGGRRKTPMEEETASRVSSMYHDVPFVKLSAPGRVSPMAIEDHGSI